LQPQDEEHLEKFLKAVGSNKKVTHSASQKGKFPNVYVHLNSVKMVKDLVVLGCHQNKSLDLEYPTEGKST
jgi:hypothetical protein